MKNLFLRFPIASRFILAVVLSISALILSGIIETASLKKYFPFTGTILFILVNWILYKTENKTLKEIGLNLTFRNLTFLLLGLLIGVVALGIQTYFRTLYTGEQWNISTVINTTILWKQLYYILPMAAVQELMFRGYCFKKTIEVSNVVIANIIFAVLFMLVHILDNDVLQNTPQLIFLAISIPVGHLLFATALLKSRTLFFPIGLHWGNNWASSHLIGQNNTDKVIFYTTHQQALNSWTQFFIIMLIFIVFFLLVTFLIWKWDSFTFFKTRMNGSTSANTRLDLLPGDE
ncbi:MAG TPA: CPBP family intramembrane glutamic endopeptidase [Phnomibacter sp.]|nr:CPBP family intramembrane glutamic endopeptidase [Phnomibacter sp.]